MRRPTVGEDVITRIHSVWQIFIVLKINSRGAKRLSNWSVLEILLVIGAWEGSLCVFDSPMYHFYGSSPNEKKTHYISSSSDEISIEASLLEKLAD